MTSETVQAAQRLLAEREAVGLKKYGTTVDRADLKPRQWLRHAIEEASDLLLYLMRLEQTMRICEGLCGPTMEITDTPDVLTMQPTPVTDFNLYTSPQPAPAAAPEDAERAAYLARWDAARAAYLKRWKGAPEWARWLSEDTEGNCVWWQDCPQLFHGAMLWCGIGRSDNAPDRLLGSFGAEPRPVQGVEG